MIAVEYKYAGYHGHHRDQWQRQIRIKDMLQCLIAGFAVAQNYKQVTGCILRYHNVCYLLTPDPGVMQTVFELIPLAKQYFNDERRVAAAQLAQFAVDRIRSTYPGPLDHRSEEGRVAHDRMLKILHSSLSEADEVRFERDKSGNVIRFAAQLFESLTIN
jgi:hypothetical protein